MTTPRYTATAIGLHWLIALMLLITFSVGLYMSGLPFSPNKLKIYSWHKWSGVTIFMLVAIRLVWRLVHTPPPLPAHMPSWQKIAADVSHCALYALMFAIPVSGWLMSSAKGFQTVYLGILPLPDLLEKNKETGDLLLSVHVWLNYTLAALVVLHVAAAFKHHFVDRDDVLGRMLPGRRSPSISA